MLNKTLHLKWPANPWGFRPLTFCQRNICVPERPGPALLCVLPSLAMAKYLCGHRDMSSTSLKPNHLEVFFRITATVYPQIWFWCQFTEKKKKKSGASHQSQTEYESTVPCCCEAGRRWMKLCKHECILHGRCHQPLLFLELLRAQRGCLVGTMSRGTWTCPSQARREQRGVWKWGQAGTAKRLRLAKDDWGRMWCQPAGR